MRSATPELIALINSGNQEWVKADLYTWFKHDGSVLARYTDADVDLTVGGNTFSSTGPLHQRDMARTAVGIEVAEMKVTVSADDTHLLDGVPWLKALRQGALDDGRLLVERFLSDSWSNLAVGSVVWFGGRVADMELGRSSASIAIKSDSELLDIMMPRNTYQPECRWTLYDEGCTLSRSAFLANSAAASGSTRQTINCSLAQVAGYFDLGTLQFTSGPNSGVWRMVRSYVPGQIVLSRPLVNVPTVGDAFNVSPGCNKLKSTCGVTVSKAFTADSASDVLTSAAHGFANDTVVRLVTSGTLPAPLTTTDVYFVVDAAANTFRLAATLGGAAIDLSSNGSGAHSVVVAGKFGNLPNFGGQPLIPLAETLRPT